jgi:molybdopterin synthase sulfur carrier subunit
VKLLYFAWVRQKIGLGEESLSLPDDVKTAAQLANLLAAHGGAYADVFADTTRLRVAINQSHARFDSAVSDDDEVAFFPPVTGG